RENEAALREALDRLRSQPDAPAAGPHAHPRVQALVERAAAAQLGGRGDEAARLYQEASTLARSLKDEPGEAAAALGLASTFMAQGDTAQAVRAAEQALALCRKLQDRDGEAIALAVAGLLYGKLEQWDKCRQNLEAALPRLEVIKNHSFSASVLNQLGMVYQH